ncbi:Threonine synthase [Candidatus Vidania fulgoroideae]|nr:Threonine synthase [Candidatus Vidania fulgoroideae]
MIFINTRDKKKYTFFEILMKSMSKKGGLFLPYSFPKISLEKILKKKKYNDIFFYIFKKFLTKKELSKINLKKIIDSSFNKKNFLYKKEIINISKIKAFGKKISILNISKGRSGSFKDMAISFLSNLLKSYTKKKKINVITSTSGDTGSSCITFIKKCSNINTFILSPYKGTSKFQANQMFTVNKKNIFNINVRGDFDKCQEILKNSIVKEGKFSTLNSINFVRIISQSVYYAYCYKFFKKPMIFSIPTGNFGNAYSAYLAFKMGIPIKKVILCNNENDTCYNIFNNKIIVKKKVLKTNSPSMDILVPSNLERFLYEILKRSEFKKYLKGSYPKIKKNIFFESQKCSARERREIIKEVYNKNGIIIDTHTANSLIPLYRKNNYRRNFICVSTASYVKFTDSIFNILNIRKNIKIIDEIKKKRKKTFIFSSKDKNKLSNFIRINKT